MSIMNNWLASVVRVLFQRGRTNKRVPSVSDQIQVHGNQPYGQDIVPYDENLLERSRTQWQFGDWESLASISRDSLQYHPDRAKLALLSAAGCLQVGRAEEARILLHRASEWGCSKRQISQVLVAGVYNVLGRGASVAGISNKARGYFESSISVANPGVDAKLIGHARALREMVHLGMLPQATIQLSESLNRLKQPQAIATQAKAHQKVLELEAAWLRERVIQIQKQAATIKDVAIVIGNKENLETLKATASDEPPSKKYYGLHGLDKKLEAYIDFDHGFYVELGANDGVAQSNTLYFEKERGWHGILIEPILHNFLKCKNNRSKENVMFCAACVSEEYQDKYVRLTYANLMTVPHGVESDIADATAHAESGRIYLPEGESTVEVMAPARTLTSILDEAKAPFEMDLLSLDVEGAELEVLKGLDHARYKFRYMLIECRDQPALGPILDKWGYTLLDKLTQHDYLYAMR